MRARRGVSTLIAYVLILGISLALLSSAYLIFTSLTNTSQVTVTQAYNAAIAGAQELISPAFTWHNAGGTLVKIAVFNYGSTTVAIDNVLIDGQQAAWSLADINSGQVIACQCITSSHIAILVIAVPASVVNQVSTNQGFSVSVVTSNSGVVWNL